MSIQPIKQNTRDYIVAGTLGAVGGYSMKNLLPLSEYERKEFFTPDVMRTIKGVERKARETEYDSILVGVKEGSEDVADDVLNVFKANKDNVIGNKFDELLDNIKNCEGRIQEGVIKLSKRVRDYGKEARKTESKSVESLAKSSRPASYFVLLTSGILLSFAVLKNSLTKNMDAKEAIEQGIESETDEESIDYIA